MAHRTKVVLLTLYSSFNTHQNIFFSFLFRVFFSFFSVLYFLFFLLAIEKSLFATKSLVWFSEKATTTTTNNERHATKSATAFFLFTLCFISFASLILLSLSIHDLRLLREIFPLFFSSPVWSNWCKSILFELPNLCLLRLCFESKLIKFNWRIRRTNSGKGMMDELIQKNVSIKWKPSKTLHPSTNMYRYFFAFCGSISSAFI